MFTDTELICDPLHPEGALAGAVHSRLDQLLGADGEKAVKKK